MSLGACLPGLEADGTITREQAAEARALYEEALERHLRSGSRESAEALASAAALEGLERAVTRKEFLSGLAIKRQMRIRADLATYSRTADPRFRQADGGDGSAPIDPRAAIALIDHDPRSAYSNVEGRRKAILGQAHRRLSQLLTEHSANLLGKVRAKAQLEDLVRELFGEDSGNASAKAMATAWRQTAEELRQRWNRAGGDTGFRADWGLPQTHDWRAIRAAGFETWRGSILPKLDLAKMIDSATGRAISREKLEAMLPEIYDNLRSNGWARRSPGAAGKGALANRNTDARFFVFKDADAWMDYARDFGGKNAFDAMMGHVERMAREIAALEILGPNPDATLRWLKDTLEKSAALDRAPDSKAIGAARSVGKKIDELWGEYTGANLEPRNEKLALRFSNIRAFQTATKLGGAYLSSFTDFGFQASRRAFNGLAQASVLRQYLALMKPGSKADQELAIRRGLIAREAAGRTSAQSRYLMEELTGDVPRLLAEGVLRLSLLSRHTQAMRWVYGMESLATFTEAAGTAFDALEAPLRGALQRYGIDAAGWDALRQADMEVDGGVKWISPHNVGDEELASRFMEMIHEETALAVPEADLATKAMFNKLERGTWFGEIGRSALLFKSFGVSVMMRQGAEIVAMNAATKARYAGGLIIGTTLLGALSIQLKAIAGGQDPRPMADDETVVDGDFALAAMLQGGGFGIFGDFLFASTNRSNGGLAATIAGPLAGDIEGVIKAGLSGNPRGQLLREAQSFVPGGNLWYARAAFDRMLADQIQTAIDPDYRRSWSRMERYADDMGTDFWWEPGAMTPDRAPDFANSLEQGADE